MSQVRSPGRPKAPPRCGRRSPASLPWILATFRWYPASATLTRYDFMFLAALAIQGAMLAFRLETIEEAKVILIFHIVGTAMEYFKTGVGSWVYPEASLFRIGGVRCSPASCTRRSAATSRACSACSISASPITRRYGPSFCSALPFT
jgi:hypothetical protein